MLSAPKGITTQQMAGTSGVRGYGGLAEVVEALGPLNKNLTTVYADAYRMGATQQIQAGYAEAANQGALAMRGLQEQQEAGAADAAADITALDRTDPVAADLLRESNPWRAVGRRRFLAQAAAGDISAALSNDLTSNGGALSALQPGSPELSARKTALSQQVLQAYGLNGDELEVNYYVTPALNKAWDSYTKTHNKLYTEELRRSTIETSTVAVGSQIVQWMGEGITLPDGRVIKPGTPEFGVVGGMILTRQIDSGLAMLAGNDKTKALKALRDQLLPTFGSIPGAADLLQNVRGGNASMSMDQRPRWVDSMPNTMLKGAVQGQELRNRQYQAEQTQLENGAEADFQTTVAVHEYGSPEYQQALGEFRSRWTQAGFRDVDSMIRTQSKDLEGVAIELDPTDPIALAEMDQDIRQLPPDMFRPGNRDALRDVVRRRASLEPTREARLRKASELWKEVTKREKELSRLPPGSTGMMQDQVRILMNDPEIQKLDVGKKAQSAFSIPGISMDQAVSASSNVQYQEYYAGVRQMMRAETMKLTREWYAKPENQGAERIPEDEFSGIVAQARLNVGNSPERKELYQQVTQTNAAGQPVSKPNQPPAGPRAEWKGLPDRTVRQYNKKAIIQGKDLYAELKALQSGSPTSAALDQLSGRAKTNKYNMLLQQLKFFPDMDPSGKVKSFLEEKARATQANTNVSNANYRSFSSGTGLATLNPYAPGAWLMRMMPRTGYQSATPSVSRSAASPIGRVTSSGGGRVTQSSIEGLLRQAGWPENLISTMGAVAMAESGGDAGVVNDNRGTGDLSYGLMQINMIDELGPDRMRRYGLSSYDDLKDPLTNLRVALQIYREQGIGAWGAYTNGSYRRFLR